MVVALGALKRGPQPDCPRDVHAVENLIGTTGLFGRTGFRVKGGGSMKPGGYALPEGGGRQKVAGELLDGETIKGHVVVKGLHDPVAPCPAWTDDVLMNTCRITIACKIEPVSGPTFAEVARTKQAVDHLAFRLGRGIL